jgi:hypothetical protein
MSEELRAYFAAKVPLPDWAERSAVIDYLVGYERRLEATEYFDEARVRALVARIVDRTSDMAASVTNHALAEEGELVRGRGGLRSSRPCCDTLARAARPDPRWARTAGDRRRSATPPGRAG